MSLPGDAFAATPSPAPLLPPDDVGRLQRTEDFERGGIALSDPSQGLDVQNWRLRLVGTEIRISHEPYDTEVVLLTIAGVTEVSLAFDQNMRPSVAYVALGRAYLYWYDTALGGVTTTALDLDVRSPFLTMDDKREFAALINTNDVLLFYIRSNRLCYRQQRDRYLTERTLAWFEGSSVSIKRAGMNAGQCVQVDLVGSGSKVATGAVLGAWRSAAYLAGVASIARNMPDGLLANDSLHAVVMHRGACTPPAGWTPVISQACTRDVTTQTISVYRKNTVAPADSGVSQAFSQSASDRMGLLYFAVRRTDGAAPTYIGATSSVVNDLATNTVTAPVVAAAAAELYVTLATTINGVADVNQVGVAPGMSVISGSASQTRLGAAYQRRSVGQTNAGRFTFDIGTPVNNGLAALTLRFT